MPTAVTIQLPRLPQHLASAGLSLSSQALPPGRAPQSALPRAPTAGRRQGQAAFSRDQACAAHASVQITVWMGPGQLLQGTRLFCVASKRLQYKHKLLKAFCMGK